VIRINLARRGHHLERNLLGQRFVRLVVVARARGPRGRLYWKCRCDCGGTIVTAPTRLIVGRTVSCGCKRAEDRARLVVRSTTHGGAKAARTPEYLSWRAMLGRCTNPNDTSFAGYGGRGIQVCDRWRESFAAFLADMGPRPSPVHSIERNEPDGNYEPSNCRWATTQEQSWNRRNTIRVMYRGRRVALAQVLHEAGGKVKRATALDRIRRGWSVEEAVEVAP
jgi:hypothetical protein